ncbi:hypothetical protein [Leifsonia sp. C5G2]|uniref:hypothetical protein n=1 Tax=Leifsonia sp. C5G2 TaxID=2735269 RepID=UPI0015859BD3|nr:hypothetical protein [Leifsonia sp. C5G2]NUU06530.1 hypothetical protein [Leifsonia sp. C5G2]
MTVLTDDALRGIAELDASDSQAAGRAGPLGDGMMAAAARPSAALRRANGLKAACVATGVILSLATLGAVYPTTIPGGLQFVLVVLSGAIPFGALYVLMALAITLDRSALTALKRMGVVAYFDGGTPYSGRRLLLGHRGLYRLGRSGELSMIPWSEIHAAGVEVRMSGCVIVLAVQDGFVGFASAGRVGGPLASGWSLDGLLGIGQLRRSIEEDFSNRGVPLASADFSRAA